MLPKENRLKKKKDFERAFEKGRNIKGDTIYLKVLKTEEPFSRIGFIVSKKISLKAVERNKIKRRMRDSVKRILNTTENGLDIIVTALPKIKKSEFKDIKEDITKTFEKIKQ